MSGMRRRAGVGERSLSSSSSPSRRKSPVTSPINDNGEEEEAKAGSGSKRKGSMGRIIEIKRTKSESVHIIRAGGDVENGVQMNEGPKILKVGGGTLEPKMITGEDARRDVPKRVFTIPRSKTGNAEKAANDKEKKANMSEKYDYLTLYEIAEDLKAHLGDATPYRKEGVFTYGVVMSFTHPTLCMGKAASYNKYQASYFLADPSQPESFDANVNLNVFANNLEEFPVIRSLGDVLRCHRVNAQFYNGLQLVAPKKRSSFVTFHHKYDPRTGLGNFTSGLGDSYNNDSFYSNKTLANKASLTNLSAEEYGVYATSTNITFNAEDTKRVKQATTWSTAMMACRSLKDKMTDMLSLRGAVDTFNRSKGVAVEAAIKVDVVAVFVGLSGPVGTGTAKDPAAGVRAHFWDGTVPGSIGLRESNPKITSTTLRALNQSMHSSAVYGETSMVTYEEFLSLSNRVVLPTDDTDPQVLYSGSAEFAVNNHFAQKHLQMMPPGTWVRLRNLHVVHGNPHSTVGAPSIESDTHCVAMPPYSLDPARIAQEFKVGVSQIAIAVNAQSAQYRNVSAVAASRLHADSMGGGARRHSEAVDIINESLKDTELDEEQADHNAIVAAEALPRQKVSNTGEELTAVTLIMGTPAPAKFCCRCKIVGYYPRDLSRWVVNKSYFREQIIDATGDSGAVPSWARDKGAEEHQHEQRPESEVMNLPSVDDLLSGRDYTGMGTIQAVPKTPKKAFLFSIAIGDDTAETDVILSGKDAEFFLGGLSPDKYYDAVMGTEGSGNSEIIENLQKALDGHIRSQTVLQMYIRSYTENVRQEDIQKGRKKYKRFSAYNSRLPF